MYLNNTSLYVRLSQATDYLYYAPSRWSSRKKSNLVFKLKKMLSWKWLGKSMCKLIFKRDMSYTKSSILNLILDKMKIYCNMLDTGMKNWIGTKLSGSYIIIVNDRAVRKRYTKIIQEITNEIKFKSCICN